LQRGGGVLQRHPFSRMAWRRAADGARLYVSGQDFPLPPADARRIAASERIDGALYAALSPAGRDAVHALLPAGSYQWRPEGRGVNPPGPFQVVAVDHDAARPQLRAVREAVFIREQGVPAGIEIDDLDPRCRYVLARDRHGRPIGTARLAPDGRIGRMAVLPE